MQTANAMAFVRSPYIEPGRPDHVEDLVGRLREEDRNEVIAITGRDPDEMLRRCWSNSLHRWAVIWDRRVICLYGVAPLVLTGVSAAPWLMAADELEDIRVPFARHCKEVLAGILELYPHLFNWVDARNSSSIKWLKWMGFRLSEKTFPYGAEKRPFYYFEKRRGVV